jgi:hypothetical protein
VTIPPATPRRGSHMVDTVGRSTIRDVVARRLQRAHIESHRARVETAT